MEHNKHPRKKYSVTILAYPGMTMLDAIGPNEVLANSPHFAVQWASTEQTPISNKLRVRFKQFYAVVRKHYTNKKN
jgi:putative intracellular protease/amidase